MGGGPGRRRGEEGALLDHDRPPAGASRVPPTPQVVPGLDDVGDASVYGTLRRLYQADALKSYVVAAEEGPHRKYYGATPAGHDLYETWITKRRGFAEAMDVLIDAPEGRRREHDHERHGDHRSRPVPQGRGSHLAALPAEERADLLDDLAQHLREIAAEPGPPFTERLGSLESYAAEILASAGSLPAAGPRPTKAASFWPPRCARRQRRPGDRRAVTP